MFGGSARRAVLTVGVAIGCGAMVVGCAPITLPSPPPTSAPTTEQASASPTGDPDAIRTVDFGAQTWMWDTLGSQYPVTLADGAATETDAYYDAPATFMLGEVVYSDANDDGLTDAAVALTWESGNGISDAWYVWLAQADDPGHPQQIPYPIAFGARCGDAVRGVTAIPGGFRIEETMRSALEQAGPCAQSGTMQRTREVGVVGDGTAAGSWPTTLDGLGWGGYCPVMKLTEGTLAPADGRVGPSDDAPTTAATGDRLFSPHEPYPFLVPSGWTLSGFLPDERVDDSLICVWMPKTA